MSYVLADTSACAGAKNEIVLVQSSRILPQPSPGLETAHVWTKDILVVPYNRGVHTNVITGRDMHSRYLEPAHWRDSRHCQANTWVQTHCFLDDRAQGRQIRCLAEPRWRAQLSRTRCIVDLFEQLCIYFWILHQVIEDGAECDGRGI